MSLLEGIGDLAEEHPWPLVAGVAVAALLVSPRIYRATARPLLKGAIKEYLALRSRLRGMCAGVSQHVRQTYAEAADEAKAPPAG
jgi:hypothetical protein